MTGRGWRFAGACAGGGSMDLFFGPGDVEQWRVQRRREAKAKAVCAGCPVRLECAAFAIASGAEFGIWGGMSEDELRARRARSPGQSRTIKISRPRGPRRKAA